MATGQTFRMRNVSLISMLSWQPSPLDARSCSACIAQEPFTTRCCTSSSMTWTCKRYPRGMDVADIVKCWRAAPASSLHLVSASAKLTRELGLVQSCQTPCPCSLHVRNKLVVRTQHCGETHHLRAPWRISVQR